MESPGACTTCHLRLGLGRCTTCTIRAVREGGVDNLEEFTLLVDDYFNWVKRNGSEPAERARLLQAWLKGEDVDLRSVTLLTDNLVQRPALFALYQDATNVPDAEMQEIVTSFDTWRKEPGDDFWFYETGPCLLIAIKFPQSNQGVYMWFSSQTKTAQLQLPPGEVAENAIS